MKINTEFDLLPKFIIGDDGGDRDFIVHLHYPRFVMEFDGISGTPLFIDDESEFIQSELASGREPATALSKLLREAGDFFMDQINRDD